MSRKASPNSDPSTSPPSPPARLAGVRLRAGGRAAELVDQFQPQALGLCLEALLLRRPDPGRLRGPAGARRRRARLRHLLLRLPLQARSDGRLLSRLGAQFYDYSRERTIIFDDLADDSRSRYEATWRARKGADRKWNIGYVRSPRWENQNSYGETLGDLSRIIRDAPEPKRCLMKRLFEYMTAENQTIDGGYLDHLTQSFEKEAAHQLIGGDEERHRAHRQEPDLPRAQRRAAALLRPRPGRQGRQRPALPRRLHPAEELRAVPRHHLRRRRQPRPRRLDHAPDGKNSTFPHLDDAMRQRPAQDTITRMMERLSSSDPKQRMPKNKIMSSQERQELYLWTQQELSRIGKGDVQ